MATQVTTAGRITTTDQFAYPKGIWSWISTVDHKRIGTLYLVTSMFFFLVGGIEALLIRIQLTEPESTFISASTYNQLFTMHGTTMIFLVVMPLSAAFFNLLVPLMIGARDVAFPRLNAFSYWVYLFGAILINLGWFHGAAPDAGWFAYANLTSQEYSAGQNVDYWVMGVQVLGLSSLASAFNFIVTIINMRAPGMGMMRLPVFVWMTLVTAVLIVMAFPSLTVGVTLLLFDRWFDTLFFVPEANGQPLLWQHLFWIFGHPEVYILILPAFGIVSEIIPVFSKKPIFGYTAVVFAGIAIGILGFSVWAHHMFTVGLGPVPTAVFAISTMLIALPTGVKIFNWIGTVWGGDLTFTTPMLMALGMVSMFIIGGLSGVMHASPPVDSHQQDSYFVVAHFHYVLFGGSLFSLFGGIYYWWPKFFGRLLNDGLGKVHFALMFIGFNLTFFPMHWVGVQGMPRRIYTYAEGLNWDFWNMAMTVGAFIIALSILVFLINAFLSFRDEPNAPDDPWDGATLEWATSSPPKPYNFEKVPVVTSNIPLWVEKYPEVYGHEPDFRETSPDPEDQPDVEHGIHEHHDDHIHMPNPTIWPLIVSIGITLGFAGFLYGWIITFIGVAVMFLGIYGWVLSPAFGEPDHV
ncbi:MAG TPA: cytochrome c oxidase subunit I [Thermomicrobiales bacterium]|nr:cytochrome c oxidase subunit I [Thermomicrobiales bacterium]